MAEILLSSETFVKSVTNISDNVAGKFILPALREAQEVKLRGIVGDCLLRSLKDLATPDPETGARPIDEPERAAYKDLVSRAQYFLAWSAVVEVLNTTSYKVGSFGVAKSNDENLQVVTQDEIAKQQFYYQSKADGCCRDLQRWILRNRQSFPELKDCDCAAMQSNLRSSATSGLWLGGVRGRRLPGGGGCCR